MLIGISHFLSAGDIEKETGTNDSQCASDTGRHAKPALSSRSEHFLPAVSMDRLYMLGPDDSDSMRPAEKIDNRGLTKSETGFKNEHCEPNLPSHDVTPSVFPVPESNVSATCRLQQRLVETPSEGCTISDRDNDPSLEWAGGCPGAGAELMKKYPRLKEFIPLLRDIARGSEDDRELIKDMLFSILSQPSWDPKTAAIVGANVGAETDEHEYKSLMLELTKSNKPPSADRSKKPPPIVRPCKDTSEVLEKVVDNSKEINAMLNHHTRGSLHFGIDKSNTVEEGLDLPQEDVIEQLQTRVGQVLQGFYPPVQSHFVRIQSVLLRDNAGKLTGWWRFDICVTPYDKDVVLLSRELTIAYYRQGGNSEPMPADLMERLRENRLAKRRLHAHQVSVQVLCVE